jgi:hypothetical protein
MEKNELNRSSFFFRFFVTAFFCLSGTAFLWGQEKGYRIEDDGRFVQTLNWEEQESALYYEVEIEKQSGGGWKGALTGKTEEPFFEVSLGPGTYRYRIRPYDFLERPGPASDWIRFAIFPSRQPELLRFSPEVFYLDEDTSWVITISGKNLADGIEAFLKGSEGSLIKPELVTTGQSRNEARLLFSYGQLEPGAYAIHVTNPGGLTAERQTFRIALGKPLDLTLSAGYKPLAPLYGHGNKVFGMLFSPAGAYSRLSVIPVKRRQGHIGFELEPSWNYALAAGNNYDAQTQMPGVAIYGLNRLRLAERTISFDFRIGGGIYSTLKYRPVFTRGSIVSTTTLIPAIVAGASVQWLVKNPFFIEAGLDVSNFFTTDAPLSGYLRPFAGLGWRF